jgi:hypothetical protein
MDMQHLWAVEYKTSPIQAILIVMADMDEVYVIVGYI